MNTYMMVRYLCICGIALFFCSCTPFGEPKVDYRDGNVLKPRISFSLDDSLQAWVTWWPANRPGQARRSAPYSFADKHVTLINVLPDTEYRYQLNAIRRNGDTLRSKLYGFRTAVIPDSIYRVSKEKIDTTVFSGYILLRRYFKLGVDLMLNASGDMVWYHPYDSMVSRPVFFTPRKTLLSIYDTAGIVELDYYGNKLMEIDMAKHGSPGYFHQDILESPDGSVVTLSVDSAKTDLSKYGWGKDRYLRTDAILKMDRNGKTLWRWNALMPGFKSEYYKLERPTEVWGHANALLLDKDGNYLISYRDFSQVWKVNAKTGEVMWRLGKGGTIKMPEEAYFIRQHSIRWTAEGDLILFDNGEFKQRRNSRVLVLRIDEEAGEAKIVDLVNLPINMSSYRMCSAQKIAPDRFLVCITRKNATVAVIDGKANVLWKVIGNFASYRAQLIAEPFPFEN